ncbi:hypothetical protein H6P81_019819 [Aristolochia fimbriata]|uniref:protein-serine/threonine phosphatase n=1 Tax=Aristolochia fimbriata TaxID=158543 RepID=A0AAV7DT12_ARIFI|nr:hypothetical protein H6P81_019819 [Aristolochia fimbriata]
MKTGKRLALYHIYEQFSERPIFAIFRGRNLLNPVVAAARPRAAAGARTSSLDVMAPAVLGADGAGGTGGQEQNRFQAPESIEEEINLKPIFTRSMQMMKLYGHVASVAGEDDDDKAQKKKKQNPIPSKEGRRKLIIKGLRQPAYASSSTNRSVIHDEKDENQEEEDDEVEEYSGKHFWHGYHLVQGKQGHDMEYYVVAQIRLVDGNHLGLYAIFDGHSGQHVGDYLQSHLFDNILDEPDFWTRPERAMRRAYRETDVEILDGVVGRARRGGSTAVTAIVINGEKLIVANVGDSRAIISRKGVAEQLSVDHEPERERGMVESKGGFVSQKPGRSCVARVDGQLAMTRAFGDEALKQHITSEPDVTTVMIDPETELLLLGSDGLWKVMSNQEAVDSIMGLEDDPQEASEHLIREAVSKKSIDDISCIVLRGSLSLGTLCPPYSMDSAFPNYLLFTVVKVKKIMLLSILRPRKTHENKVTQTVAQVVRVEQEKHNSCEQVLVLHFVTQIYRTGKLFRRIPGIATPVGDITPIGTLPSRHFAISNSNSQSPEDILGLQF